MFLRCLMMLVVGMSLLGNGRAEAFVFIHEVLADPATSLSGDANGDGVRDTSDDEFIEVYNSGTEPVDISQWSISDATSKRHTFAAGSILNPNALLVIFGGGQPLLSGIAWQTASTGQLNLNNTAETITLFDIEGQVIDFVTYGSEANSDQSIARSPEGAQGAWVKHASLSNANGRLFSPGTFINEPQKPDHQSTVPEPATIISLLSGMGALAWQRSRKAL